MQPLYTVQAIRAAEEPLLAAQDYPDELMQSAAHAVAGAALDMLASVNQHRSRILVLAGSGGNGGDALYAGAELALAGYRLTAILVGSRPHGPALEAFRNAGGTVVEAADGEAAEYLDAPRAALAIDGVAGLGGKPGLRPAAQRVVAQLEAHRVPILSVDLPSGITADHAETPEPATPADGDLPDHVTACVTVTFGGLRRVHGLHPACGQVLLAEIATRAGRLSEVLAKQAAEQPGRVTLTRAIERSEYSWNRGPARALPAFALPSAAEPEATADKYSQGVAGILAGSPTYPGAGLLCCAGALRATPAMVRYVGRDERVVSAYPEVVRSETLEHTGRVQAWVVGPGRGTGEETGAELDWLLRRDEPVIIDADALTVLAESSALRRLAAGNGRCVLAPHAGEFARFGVGDGRDRIDAARALAAELNATVLLKGRFTVVAQADRAAVVDAGHSWSATPGSGDVLAGVLGALVAGAAARGEQVFGAVVAGCAVHARAAWLAAQTEYGPGPIVASDIAAFLPRAIAQASPRL
ncbi:hypothetical protein CATYP_10280 [Corynebacterium atypicum]|uniref:ADP-dependent (S)-NAD(P)H-hydrate dehydratase n=1 Tax=Corynebacterium atypicum TaxID=191610 RepID=A0ABM5QQ37_9CORY|nr:bifunctional ADP-dependent NAD(P)H-hydrate dehydratase/NAD(P)H-hydrate epimerase [Corynebacterium atypicum]AIG64867.1 hypothetical protein CATYP_10280 [Corynebacterium atypicum]